jgi:Zn-dependent membrane protease YugP
MILDFNYLLFLAPAMLLGLWAQMRVRSAFAEAQRVRTPLSGAAAARAILDSAGLRSVAIEQVPGQLSDHYDPGAKVLRLSQPVYNEYTMAAVGVAAHEAGHALQDAQRYAPLVFRSIAVPAASFGGGFGVMILMLGLFLASQPIIWLGILAFSGVVAFQLINLPVEFDASRRAKHQLDELRIVPANDQAYVNSVLNAAAWTYVAGTLQSVMTLLYYVMHFGGAGSRDE